MFRSIRYEFRYYEPQQFTSLARQLNRVGKNFASDAQWF
jgi:hypothetical protein